jgi:hypothetical protein
MVLLVPLQTSSPLKTQHARISTKAAKNTTNLYRAKSSAKGIITLPDFIQQITLPSLAIEVHSPAFLSHIRHCPSTLLSRHMWLVSKKRPGPSKQPSPRLMAVC